MDNVRERRGLWNYCTLLTISSLFLISFCARFIIISKFLYGNHDGAITYIIIFFDATVSILLCLWPTTSDRQRSGTLRIFSSCCRFIFMVLSNFSKLGYVSIDPGYPGLAQIISSCFVQLVFDCKVRLFWISFIFIIRCLSPWTTSKLGVAQLRCRIRISSRCAGACNRRFKLVARRILIGIFIGLGIGVVLMLRFGDLGFVCGFFVSGWRTAFLRAISTRSNLLCKLYWNKIRAVEIELRVMSLNIFLRLICLHIIRNLVPITKPMPKINNPKYYF